MDPSVLSSQNYSMSEQESLCVGRCLSKHQALEKVESFGQASLSYSRLNNGLNDIYDFSTYLTVNTTRLHDKDLLLNVTWENIRITRKKCTSCGKKI
jgi:hypothetical protein